MASRYPFNFEPSGTSEDAKVISYLRELWVHVALANSRLQYFQELNERASTYRSGVWGRTFFLMAEDALYLDAALTIEKLFDPSGDRSLARYLNRFEQSRKVLVLRFEDLVTPKVIQDQHDQIAHHKNTYDKLRTLRDSWLAHHDKKAFDNPREFSHVNFLPRKELQPLVETANSIVTTHYEARDGGVVYDLPGREDLVRLLELVSQWRETMPKWASGKINSDQAMEELFPNVRRVHP